MNESKIEELKKENCRLEKENCYLKEKIHELEQKENKQAQPLTWNEMVDLVSCPVWDNWKSKWRVIDSFCFGVDYREIIFTDVPSCRSSYNSTRFYDMKIERED